MRGRLIAVGLLIGGGVAAADPPPDACRVVDVQFVPSGELQIAVWVEDAAGHYVDTAFITQATGLRGLGNRTGVMDLKSGPMWPYGSRLDVLPVWAHRQGLTFPQITWQGGDGIPTEPPDLDNNILTAFADSSSEPYYCRPLQPTEPSWDAMTCPSAVFTDKGKMSVTLSSVYPPRADIAAWTPGDSHEVAAYATMNPFDAVSGATPAAGAATTVYWRVPDGLAAGSYVAHVEVSKERDFNAVYTMDRYPTVTTPWPDYGVPYRGQPSIVYDVPFTIGATLATNATADYAGYSDVDGVVHAPDATITTDTPASGASRLQLASDGGALYRVKVTAHPESDAIAPGAPEGLTATHVATSAALLSMTAPGNDGAAGTPLAYEIRYAVGDALDEATFASATPLATQVAPVAGGQTLELAIDHLAPHTRYVVGVRARDACRTGPLAIARFETPEPEVAGCGGCSTGSAAPGLALLGLFALRRGRRRGRFSVSPPAFWKPRKSLSRKGRF